MKPNQHGADLSRIIAEMVADREQVAYQRGWDDALAAMTAAVKVSTAAPMPAKKVASAKQTPSKRKTRKPFLVNKGPSKARAIVLQTIQQNPGRSGTELAAMVAAAVNKHTVRTQLRKLKKSGEAEQNADLRWFAKGDQKQAA